MQPRPSSETSKPCVPSVRVEMVMRSLPCTRRIAPVVKLDASRREVERGADDLVRLAAALQRDARFACLLRTARGPRPSRCRSRNGPAMMQFTRTFGPKACAKAIGHRVQPGLRRGVRGLTSASAGSRRCCDTLMIEPPSPAAMRVPTSAESRNGPFRFTSSTLSHSASVTFDDVVGRAATCRRCSPARRPGRSRA